MGKRHEAALKAKPILLKGAQTLDDAEALEVKGIYFEWEDLLNENHKDHTAKQGYKFRHGKTLYKTEQPEYTFVGHYVPGETGTESLFSVIDETHAGTLDDPIPYNGNMELESGKYYIQDGVIYLCTRDTVNPVVSPLAALVGIYVEVA